MENDAAFLETLKKSFIKFLKTGARSNKKLKILHSFIANDLCQRLKSKNYTFYSLGFQKGKEVNIKGRYIDKKVDITVRDTESNSDVCGIGVKFVMNNYAQNSNNYFENMLGETANIRCNNIPYFQVFCIFDSFPYYDKKGNIKRWEQISTHHLEKYIKLSSDNVDNFYHTPNKTLVYIVHIDSNTTQKIKTKKDYRTYYLENPFTVTKSALPFTFGNAIIYNDYKKFIEKVFHTIKSR